MSNGGLLLDRGYTSHEHFAEVGLIHMNGRLYDPLLRRFLNADENIQDMFNTQNYNKYGYVLNNPLMYNDPSGEFIPLIAAAIGWIVAHSAAIITGALIGAAIGAGMYLVQAAITGQWSWGGFAKSIFMGAITGAVSGGLGQVFSAGGFWASVGNGALAGAGSGGITSLINGQNFLEGVLKGAVIGGVIGGITWKIGQMVNKADTSLDYADAGKNPTSNSTATNDTQGDKLNWFNKEKDGYLYKAAELDKNVPEGTIRIYTHGNPKGFAGPNNEWITNPKQFDNIILQRSETWRNFRELGGSVKVELMSCQTGRWSDGIASRLSKAFRNSEFIAPSTKFFAGPAANGGVYSDIAGRFKFFNPGRWNHFIDGINITGILDKYRNIWQQNPGIIKWR